MLLLLMRHGEAESPVTNDFERRLTREGEKQVQRSCESIRDKYSVAQILASPLVRAQQTAQIAAGVLNPPEGVLTFNEVEPSGDSQVVATRLNASSLPVVMVVTHQPFVGNFVEYLTGESVSMGTATIACIRADALYPQSGELECLIRP